MPSSQKGISLILIILLIAIVMIGGGFLILNQIQKPDNSITETQNPLPSPDEIANWKTYVNRKYRYSLKYPQNLFAAAKSKEYYNYPEEADFLQLCRCSTDGEFDSGAYNGPVVINVKDKATESVEDFVVRHYKHFTKDDFKSAQIAGTAAIRIVNKDSLIPTEDVFFKKDGLMFHISLVKDQPYDDPKQIDVFNRILSTFKFLDSKTSPDGKKVLKLETGNEANNYINTLTVADTSGSNSRVLYSEKLEGAGGLILPDNPWSPNSKYFFILFSHPDSVNSLIFRADGQNLGKEDTYLDVGKLMQAQQSTYRINGSFKWLNDSQIQFTTLGKQFSKGPDYAFDINSQSFKYLTDAGEAEVKEDVDSIVLTIKGFYENNNYLPATLDEAYQKTSGGYLLKINPFTKKRYEYTISSDGRAFTVSGMKKNGEIYKIETLIK